MSSDKTKYGLHTNWWFATSPTLLLYVIWILIRSFHWYRRCFCSEERGMCLVTCQASGIKKDDTHFVDRIHADVFQLFANQLLNSFYNSPKSNVRSRSKCSACFTVDQRSEMRKSLWNSRWGIWRVVWACLLLCGQRHAACGRTSMRIYLYDYLLWMLAIYTD